MGNLVQLTDVHTYLQITYTTDDALLSQLIANVSAAIENYCNRSLSAVVAVTDTLDGAVAAFILSKRPVVSITTLTDLFSNAAIASTYYDLDANAGLLYAMPDQPTNFEIPAGMFEFFDGERVWGAGRRRWQIVYQAGYATVPYDVQQAALIMIAERYNRRDPLAMEAVGDYRYQVDKGDQSGWSAQVEQLLKPYKEVIF